jgi:hypothetical protein
MFNRAVQRPCISSAKGVPRTSVPLRLRIDTPIEAAYFSAGGILPYVLNQLLAAPGSPIEPPAR